MTPIDPEEYELLTFDCYGTLIDWERGIADALGEICRSHGVDLDDEALLAHFAAVEHGIQAGDFLPYREVLARVLDGVGARLGFTPTEDQRRGFGASVAAWPPFPDTVAALELLAKRYKLAIVSNVDDDLFAGSAEQLRVPFDWVVTAQQVGSYKPAPAHFHEVMERTGVPKDRILHVAQSLFHDIAPAGALGFTTMWVNRRSGQDGDGATPPADATPDIEVPDMASAANLLTGS